MGSGVEEVAAVATLLRWQLQEQALDGVMRASGGGGGCGEDSGGNVVVQGGKRGGWTVRGVVIATEDDIGWDIPPLPG